MLSLGLENGSPLEKTLSNLDHFYSRGIRYITLCHDKSNHICDSSYDSNRLYGAEGISDFGKQVVAKMNSLGIMIDVSHISDTAFWSVLKLSKAPVVATHSSCRHFTEGWERNMSDDMIKAMAEHGGVIQITFGSKFLTEDHNKKSSQFKYAHVRDVARHVIHSVELVGAEHVGFGSDFEGVGDTLPEGLKSAADFPNLLLELLKKEMSHDDIRKICGLNLVRVWSEVESVASESC